ncbi:hypothetical protein BGW39_003690 [Mortierella sp. 14UC]|nr:hypothetical protein BGW39_003690 [Mortierella sp. 14UC]
MGSDNNATKFFNVILQNCPSINVLRLSTSSRSFTSGQQIPTGYPSQELFRVANTYRGLREIEMIVRLQEKYPIIPTLLLHSGWSLEVIDLGVYCTEALIVRNPFISSILQACSRLKSLAVHNQGSGRSCISLRELVETNWASNQLENLRILVSEANYGKNGHGWVQLLPEETRRQQDEDTAMLLFQLSTKYRAQKKYTGILPIWWEVEAHLLPYETAVKHTDGAMNPAAWKRIRPEVAPPEVPPRILVSN